MFSKLEISKTTIIRQSFFLQHLLVGRHYWRKFGWQMLEGKQVAIENLRGIGPISISLVPELGNRITDVSGSPLETSYLRQRLGIAQQRGNATYSWKHVV